MKKTEFEEALRLVGETARDRDPYVFGSQAVPLIIENFGRRSTFATRSKYYVDCVSPDLSTLPDGWTERLVPFQTKNTGGVTAWCLEIHDLCLAKLAAGRPKIPRYIRALLRHRFARPEIIDSRLEDLPTTTASKQTMRVQLQKLVNALRPKRRTPASRQRRK
jgi:hypothetical protein